MLVVLAILFAACVAFVPYFLSAANLKSMLLAVSIQGMVACTMLFCLASGNFDLSVGTLVPCAGVIAAIVTNKTGSYAAGLSAGLAFGMAVGLINGVVVALCRINPLITTLATMQIVYGINFVLSRGELIGVLHPGFKVLGGTSLLGLELPVWICLGFFAIFGFLLDRTTFGRNTLAIGGNEEAARLAGIAVARTKIVIFALQGIVAAFAGIVLASQFYGGEPKVAAGLELQVISACVLGGVSLSGGVGRMSFVIAGVMIMGIVENSMNLLHVDPYWQNVVRGSILLAAVLFDRFKQRG